MKIKYLIFIFAILLLLIFGCTKKINTENQPTQKIQQDIILPLSKVPPTDYEILKLRNGYKITTGMATLINKKCEENGLMGGDTGNGYGCLPK